MHTISFINCKNDWTNALPLGNGCFGAMAFYDGSYTLPMNHYEVYYNISPEVLPSEKEKKLKVSANAGETHKMLRRRADLNRPAEGEPFYYYRLSKAEKEPYGTSGFSGSYPATGELRYGFEGPDTGSRLELKIEKAEAVLELGSGTRLETIAARKDLIITRVKQSGGKRIKKIAMVYPDSRDRDYPEVKYMQISESAFAYTVAIALSEAKTFRFAGIIRLVGNSGRLSGNEIIPDTAEEFTVLTGIYTDWRYADPLNDGLRETEKAACRLEAVYAEHRAYWTEFFSRAKITLPDKFLEKVYFINQYALDCSSGRGGIMKHHACGLNGLWDIRHPNLWGSMWYWDVNIQAAFAGVFSSNRTELGKTFSDGLLSYVKLAENFAENVHGIEGVSMDYPYTLYYSTWPWCAQYLWSQYEYTQDLEYLRNEAYPLFKKLCRFAVGLFEYDAEKGRYFVYPDISPEQGPLACNSVITVASVKYMLKFTLEAAELLGDADPLLDDVKKLYGGLPEYPTAADGYGRRFIDSESAPANLWIRHPSMLMPVFPTGEIDMESSDEEIGTVLNTIEFLSENCEIGVFQVSWLAAAAARIGRGQLALRLLYEMGIDHLLRSNGLAAEENERFMNFCLIMRQPLYYPCMMEFTGEMLAAVNEMLMQSNGGIIRLFPAMPDGDPEYGRLIRAGQSLHEYGARCSEYPKWENVRFERLLARGAFEVSAELRDGEISCAEIKSNVGGRVRITSPYAMSRLKVYEKAAGKAVEFTCGNNIIEFDAVKGADYIIAESGSCAVPEADEPEDSGVMTRLSYTKRRIYIGGDSDTEYHRAVDSFIRDRYFGNVRVENHTVYKFDFGTAEEKDCAEELPYACFAAERMLLKQMDFIRMKEMGFAVRRGYGFADADSVAVRERGTPDLLRGDFVESGEDNEFLIEAPRGQYELLAVCGDSEEASVTVLEADGGRKCGGGVVGAGRYQCSLIPLVHEKDGCIRLRISTETGYKWKLNLLMLNAVRSFS